MAKRRTARHADVDDDDDDYAWDEPEAPKKKKSARSKKKTSGLSGSSRKKGSASARKSTRSTGKTSGSTRAAGSSRSKASGSARTKKGGSARRSARRASDDGMATSGRKRRAAPPAKKDNSTVMLVSMVSITLILIVGIVLINKTRTPGEAVNHQVGLEAAQAQLNKGKEGFRAWNAAVAGGEPSQQLYDTVLRDLQQGLEKMQAILQEPIYLGPDGFLLPQYEGYEAEQQEAATLIVDMEKRGGLH